MRLIVNLGNSDLQLHCKKSTNLFVFRKRNNYFIELKNLVNSIENKSEIFNDKGEIVNGKDIEFIDADNNKHYIEKLEFPILKAEIDKINQISYQEITEVLCFITKQNPIKNSDTFLLINILNGEFGKKVFPKITFKYVLIDADPSDYSVIISTYSEILSKMNLDNTVISIAQGTPAMGLGLSQSCARLKPSIKQFYASNKNEYRDVIVKEMDQFSKTEKENLLNQLETYLSIGNYDYAKSFIKGSYLSIYEPLIDIVDYFIYRKNYKFEDALIKIKSIKRRSNIFNDIIINIERNLNYILDADPNSFDYSNINCPYLLYETLSNIKLSLNNKDYFYTMALMSALLDVLADFMIVRALNLDSLTFNNKYGSFIEVDLFLENNINLYPITNKYKDIKNKLINTDLEKIHLPMNRNTRKCLLRWVKDYISIDTVVGEYMLFMDKYSDFAAFKDLRNKLPIAHSVKGISLYAINNTLNKLDSSNNIDKALCDIDNLISKLISTKEQFNEYSLDYKLFMNKIRDYFIS
ncbi:MAG: hypothetical protein ACPKM0_12360 [Pleomorphochaeta sp.]